MKLDLHLTKRHNQELIIWRIAKEEATKVAKSGVYYCRACERTTHFKRQFGVGTLIGVVVTGGLWLLALPFYEKRCSICKTICIPNARPVVSEDDTKRCPFCAEYIKDSAILCRYCGRELPEEDSAQSSNPDDIKECPSCAMFMPSDAVLCSSCGYKRPSASSS